MVHVSNRMSFAGHTRRRHRRSWAEPAWATLPGRSRTIRVEPLELPAETPVPVEPLPEQPEAPDELPEPDEAPEPAEPEPEREPEPV